MEVASTLHEVKQQAAIIVGRYDFKRAMIYSQTDHDFAKRLYKAIFYDKRFGKVPGGRFESGAYGGVDSCGNCRNKVYGQLHTFAHEK